MAIADSLLAVLSSPTPDAVWRLRADLLELGVADEEPLGPLLDELYRYLDRLATGSSAREYSNLASKLDIGAISGVILENLAEQCEPPDRAMRLVAAAISEGLMALATRQHVKAWEGELGAVYRDAGWFLYGELWRWSRQRTPQLGDADRRRLLDELTAPIRSPDTPGEHKAVLVGRLFQVLVLSYAAELGGAATGALPGAGG